MAGVTWILTFMCVAGRHLSSASPVLRSVLAVPTGANASLTCNLTSGFGVTWYLLRSDRLLPLLTVTPSKPKGSAQTISFHSADWRRVASGGAVERGPGSLEIQQVEPLDDGLYFCTSSYEGIVHANAAIRLVVDGVEESDRLPCWSLGICVLPALLVLIFILVFIVGLYLHSGQPAVCCPPESPGVTEEESLQYSSLRRADKPRPSGRGGTRLVEVDVTYSAVMSRENASRDRG
ncbi:uncharacterized protein LOC117739347 isoform X2 [Cyclopterus lumpus]|uniref:uncharacterized protein LOC117739347 isoform X2 n=1 Tax=Cyclopterus lumpus TaxID=8103 RepID=UPI0014873A60|nr:uncharacterized protein LOC117739347 isoform X2 [Cyclopterus lumpus]